MKQETEIKIDPVTKIQIPSPDDECNHSPYPMIGSLDFRYQPVCMHCGAKLKPKWVKV